MSAPKITEVSIERAYELADQLTNKSLHENAATKVFSGNHPELGDVHITIPPMGDSLILPALLPIVIQNFEM